MSRGQRSGEVAVRIDDANAAAGFKVLEDEIPQQVGLAAPGLAEAVDVVAARCLPLPILGTTGEGWGEG